MGILLLTPLFLTQNSRVMQKHFSQPNDLSLASLPVYNIIMLAT